MEKRGKKLPSFVCLILTLLTLPSVVFGARTAGAVATYEFLKKTCLAGGSFSNLITTGAVGGTLSSVQTVGASYKCPSFTFNGVTYTDGCNGITSLGNVGVSGVLGNEDLIAANLFANATTIEFWLFGTAPTSEEVILEVARNPGTSTLTKWDIGLDYILRVSLTGFVFKLQTSIDTAGVSLVFSSFFFDTVTPKVMHVVITRHFETVDVIDKDHVINTLFINGIRVDSAKSGPVTTSSAFGFNSGATSTTAFFFAGGSFGTKVSGATIANNKNALMFFAFYPFELIQDTATNQNQIVNNFNAGLSGNVATTGSKTVSKLEDINLDFFLNDQVFDFDRDIMGQTKVITVKVLSLPTAGQLLDFTGLNTFTVPKEFPVANKFRYIQNTANVDNITDSFTFTIVTSNPDGFPIPTSTTTLDYVEQNDPPAVLNTAFEIQEANVIQVVLKATEFLDGGSGKSSLLLPQNVTLKELQVNTLNNVPDTLGKFFDCSDSSETALKNGDVIDINSSLTTGTNTQFAATVCFRAGSYSDQADALVDVAKVIFSFNDGVASSVNGTASINVFQALSANCKFLASTAACIARVEELDENATFAVTLQGLDSKCDFAVQDSACANNGRRKQFIITTPLPNPLTEGVFATVDGDVISEDVMTDGEFLLPNFANQVLFVPVNNYFNLAKHPICVKNVLDDRGECVTLDGTDLVCSGDFCSSSPAYTTSFVLFGDNNTYGNCEAGDATISSGCPIRLFHRLKVGNGKSPIETSPTQIIWVNNVIDRESAIVGGNSLGPFIPGKSIFLSQDDPIQIDDADVDAITILVKILVTGGGGTLQVDTSLLLSHPFDANLFDIGTDLSNGIVDGTTFELKGLQTALNEILAGFRYRITSAATTLFQVILLAPLDGSPPSQTTKVYRVEFDDSVLPKEKKKTIWDYKYFYAVAIFLALLLLLCVYTCCRKGCGCAMFICHTGNTAVKKNVFRGRKVNRNRGYSEDSEELERLRKLTWSYRCGVLFYCLGGPQLLTLACPCAWAFEEEKVAKGRNASESDNIEDGLDGIKTQAAVNRDDWEERTQKKEDGKTLTVYFNKKTGKTQFASPFASSKKRRKNNNKATLEHGEKKLRFKLWPKNGFRLSRSPNPEDNEEEEEEKEEKPTSKKSEIKSKRNAQKKTTVKEESEDEPVVRSARAKFAAKPPPPRANLQERSVAEESAPEAKRFAPRPPAQPKPAESSRSKLNVDEDI